MPKPIALDLPYPSSDGIAVDVKSAAVISPAYAGRHGEVTAILQYVYESLNFGYQSDADARNTLLGIAVAEMRHLEILGELLLKLGVDPVFTEYPPYRANYFTACFVPYSRTPQKMLMDAVAGEMVAVNEYGRMIERLDNERVSAIISRIMLDEELHVKVLRELLDGYCGKLP